MGVPALFAQLVKKYPHLVLKKNPFEPVDQLFIDFNAAIHPAARFDSQRSIEQIYKQILDYLAYIVNSVNPTKLIYIAIDGTCPVGKMKQQRERRFKSAKDEKELDEIKRHFGVPLKEKKHDYSMISPGTEFMQELSSRIRKYLAHQKPFTAQQVIFSDATVPGEGEHKIVKYIRHQGNEIYTNVIYGLDADLIFLSLGLRDYWNQIKCDSKLVLIRENIMIKNAEPSLTPPLHFFDIQKLEGIINEIMRGNDLLQLPRIKDFILICFFLGNDFLPNHPGLKMRGKGLDHVIDIYRDNISNNNGLIVNFDEARDKFVIDNTFLSKFIGELANREQGFLCFNKKKQDRAKEDLGRKTINDFVDMAEYLKYREKVAPKYTDRINAFNHGWEKRFYVHFFGTSHAGYKRQINQICLQYLRGIDWVLNYYLGCQSCPDWRWFYPYHQVPLFIDIHRYLNNHPSFLRSISFSPQTPIEPLIQLMYILPYQSRQLLPTELENALFHPQSYFLSKYPLDFGYEYYGKDLLWECHPKIPMFSPEYLEKYIQVYLKYLVQTNHKIKTLNHQTQPT